MTDWTCPDWLAEPARECWPGVIAELRRRGRIDIVQPQQVAIYCQTFAQYLDLTADVNEWGQTADSESGDYVRAAAQHQLKLVELLRRLTKDLGLNEPREEPDDAIGRLAERLAAARMESAGGGRKNGDRKTSARSTDQAG